MNNFANLNVLLVFAIVNIDLTEQELQSIYGGNIFTSVWNWLKKHFSVHIDRDPLMGPHGEVTFAQTF